MEQHPGIKPPLPIVLFKYYPIRIYKIYLIIINKIKLSEFKNK